MASSNSLSRPRVIRPGSPNVCWLCCLESQLPETSHSRNTQPPSFVDIRLSQGDGRAGAQTAVIAPVVIASGPVIFGKTMRTRLAKAMASGKELSLPYLANLGIAAYDQTTKVWTFQVHTECWHLVACRVPDPVALATTLGEYLIALTSGKKVQVPSPVGNPSKRPTSVPATAPRGRNYREASMQRLPSFDGLAAEMGLARLPTVGNPLPLDELGLPRLHVATTTKTAFTSKPRRKHDLFSVLPREILDQIIEPLSMPDLLSLRLASRAVACAVKLPTLPRSFWQNQFAPGYEMEFALPERVDADLDWCGMYLLIRQALRRDCNGGRGRRSPVVAGLAKRCCWWERLRWVVEMHEKAMRRRG